MSTPRDVLHAALCARPLQTANELALHVADAGLGAVTPAEVEQLLAGDPRLRPDSSVPPRWRALGVGHPGSLLNLPAPRRRGLQVLAPAASFGERSVPVAAPQPVGRGGILPAAAFAGRPSVRLQESASPSSAPVRVPVFARVGHPTSTEAAPDPMPLPRSGLLTLAPSAEPTSTTTPASTTAPAPAPTAPHPAAPTSTRPAPPAPASAESTVEPTVAPLPTPHRAAPTATWVPTTPAPTGSTTAASPARRTTAPVEPTSTTPLALQSTSAPAEQTVATSAAVRSTAPAESPSTVTASLVAPPLPADPRAGVTAASRAADPFTATMTTPAQAGPALATTPDSHASGPLTRRIASTSAALVTLPAPAEPRSAPPLPFPVAEPTPTVATDGHGPAERLTPPVTTGRRLTVAPSGSVPDAALLLGSAAPAPTVAPLAMIAEPVAPVTNPTRRAAQPLPVRVPREDRPAEEPFVVSPATPAGGLFRALGTTPAAERTPLPPGGEVRYVGPALRRWQKDVLDAWLAEDRRGIVEAVSAPGRGVVGVLAAWDALTRGEKVLVLVPSSDLLEQWFGVLELCLPGLSVGRRDLTSAHTFDECDVLVSLVGAAFGHQLLPDGQAGLLIADEVHRFGSARPAETLREGFGARLGLTSSTERQDAGFDEVLRPYFGAVLDGCDLRRGRKDGVIAPFRLGFVLVDLGADERAEHDALSAQIGELAERLAVHGCAPRTFVEDVIRLQAGWRENARAAADASAYLRAVSSRRDLLATSTAKTGAVATLAPTLARSTHALVFTHTKGDADAAADGLRAAGVPAAWLHNGLEPEVRRTTLRDLRAGRLQVLTAPKVLDEGLDLPTVDAVVVLAASRSYRQLVQRVGAVLPVTGSDRLPVVLVVQAHGTVDTDDGFVADLAAVATEVRTFDVDTPAASIAHWFTGS